MPIVILNYQIIPIFEAELIINRNNLNNILSTFALNNLLMSSAYENEVNLNSTIIVVRRNMHSSPDKRKTQRDFYPDG